MLKTALNYLFILEIYGRKCTYFLGEMYQSGDATRDPRA
jgi:hypothetical protein